MISLPTIAHPTRVATVAEQDAASAAAERLDRASDRGMDETIVAHEVPPGRLDLGQAMQADAQTQLGLPRTARPWRRRTRRMLRAPALRVGIAVDHSPSMYEALDAATTAAWIVEAATGAARQARSDVAVATFDTDAHLLTPASATHVPVLQTAAPGAANHSAALPQAVDLLRGRLELDEHPDDSRLVVVISDSVLAEPEKVARTVEELTATGTRLLWVSVDGQVPEYLPDQAATLSADEGSLVEDLPDAVENALATTDIGGYL